MNKLKENFYLDGIKLISFINLNDKEKAITRDWRNDKNIRKWMYTDHLIKFREHTKFIENIRNEYKKFYWLAKDLKKEIYLGVIYLDRIDYKNKHAYLGMYSNPKLKGIGLSLMKCLRTLAFEIVKLHSLKLEVLENNKHALNFYKKSGFKKEGRLKEFVVRDGKWLDVIIMGIIGRKKKT